MQARIIAAAVSSVLWFVTTGFAQSGATLPHNNYADGKSWLCHPGLTGTAGACDIDLRTTIIRADGTSTVENSKEDPRAPIDCFYVYPTVSTDPTPNSDMTPDAAEFNVVRLQFARFREKCRL